MMYKHTHTTNRIAIEWGYQNSIKQKNDDDIELHFHSIFVC